MSSSVQKDVRRLITTLQTAYGCRVVTGGHYKIYRPGHPGMVTVSVSPRSPEVLKNIHADLRRTFGIDLRQSR